MPKQDTSKKVHQRDKIKTELSIRERQDLTDKQKQCIDLILNNKTKAVIIKGPAGVSKAQPLDSLILLENGFVKMGEVQPGMKIFGEDGNLHEIVSIHPQGIKDIYKVSFNDGTSTEATLDHLWKTQTSKDRNQRVWGKTVNGKRKREWRPPLEGSVKTTQEIMDSLYIRNGTRVNHSIPITNSINFNPKTHIISPYVFGVLLGDGCFRKKSHLSFSSADPEIINRVNEEVMKLGLKLTKNNKYDYLITIDDTKISNIFKDEIKRMGLDFKYSYEKSIPQEYLIDSVENRLELLRGLMDSDGTVSRRGLSTSFSTTSLKLSENIRFLVESLGGICFINKYKTAYTHLQEKRVGKDVYVVGMCLPSHINPFFLKRKADLVIGKTKYKPIRYIENIEFVGKKECQCIKVNNPSSLYLTNNFIVTHNTFVAILAGLKLMNDKKISDIIYVRSIVESARKQMGALPGEEKLKLAPYMLPLMDKLEELLPKTQIQGLINDNRVHGIPINYLRGSNFAAKYLILDEFQNCTFGEIVTTITRVAEKSKLIMLADPRQADIKDSGFIDIYNLFNDQESRDNGIFTFEFTKEDIVRSSFVKFIMEKLESLDKKDGDWAPGK